MQLTQFFLSNKSAAQSVCAYPCSLVELDGTYYGPGNEWLQIHDKATAATAGNTPKKAYYIQAAGPVPLMSIFETLGVLPLINGLSIGISTTEATYTASASVFDVFGSVETIDVVTTGLSDTGAVSVNAGPLSVWTAGTSPKPKLYRIKFVNGAAAATKQWLVICSDTAGSAVQVAQTFIPLFQYLTNGTSGTVVNYDSMDMNFGQGGLDIVARLVDNSTNGQIFQSTSILGCLLFVTVTNTPAAVPFSSLVLATDVGTTLQAYYK